MEMHCILFEAVTEFIINTTKVGPESLFLLVNNFLFGRPASLHSVRYDMAIGIFCFMMQ
jgi:hypothetical protein